MARAVRLLLSPAGRVQLPPTLSLALRQRGGGMGGVDWNYQGPGVQEAKAATSSLPGTADSAVPTVACTCVPAVCGVDMASRMGKSQDAAVSLAGVHSCANICMHWSPSPCALTHTLTLTQEFMLTHVVSHYMPMLAYTCSQMHM